ncbi:MAG: aldo/keto reductase [Bacteroidales bacterium]|jgi:aryl-alcohol dehydrogenase-like predicted oxidoreductase
MKTKSDYSIDRRKFLKSSATAVAGMSLLPSFYHCTTGPKLMTRNFGRLNHEVTTFGLGGQASIQWTPDDVDPVAIIMKAFDKGVNYFDTSNLYGPSQLNYSKAFGKLDLIPGQAGYNEALRRSVFLTSKTHLRWAKGEKEMEGLNNWTNGVQGSHTIDDLKRSLTQIYGDGKGWYPEGAYLDMVLIHSVTNPADVDAIYEGLEDPDPKAERIGALAALRDYRDGTNLTGLNPKEEKLIRHIGFSGHYNAGVMMDLIRRDQYGIIDGLLVAINANDKLNFNMQHNVIPVAKARDIGLIGMKVFADGAMYSKEAHWSGTPADVVRKVGSKETPFKPLIEYSLTTPGISTVIIGIGQISDDPAQCQLSQNIAASQIGRNGLSETDRKEVEEMAARVKQGKTNYFQKDEGGLTAVRNVTVTRKEEGKTVLAWDTAYAGDHPLEKYEVWRNNEKIGEVMHEPQISQEPFRYTDPVSETSDYEYRVVTVDANGNKNESQVLTLS